MGKRLHVEDYTSPKVQEKLKEDAMIKIIKEGKVVDGRRRMKAYASTLKDDEIKALVKHIREFKKAQ
jgi:cytochrome c553